MRMGSLHQLAAFAVLVVVVAVAVSNTNGVNAECLGEFQQCQTTNECVLFKEFCGRCAGVDSYLCPDGSTCVKGAAAYLTCPGIKGTHLDWTLKPEARLDYLVAQATQAEKIAQLQNDAPAISRLGIPSYNWLNDDEHGVMQPHATVFPNGNSLGATWSKQRLSDVGLAIGREARGIHNGFVHQGERGKGVNGVGITLYAPNMNTVRDPRWGRAQEVFSEDPHLSARMTVHYVKNIQGNSADPNYLLAGACCKHYAVYDLESLPKERYYFSADVDTRNMWETYMPVFKACIKEAQASHVMCSYNAINGVPACAEPKLLNGVLRDKWKWDGFVVSDYDAWAQITETHAYCPKGDYECAATAGINAGMDQEGGGVSAINKLADAISHGKVKPATLDEAFRRLFRIRIRLGMMDPPTLVQWNKVANDSSEVLSPAHIALARQAAREGTCLYKNARNALPLSLVQPGGDMSNSGRVAGTPVRRVALIGPWAPIGDHLMGNYDRSPDYGCTSVLYGLAQAMGQQKAANCTFEKDIDYYVAGEGGYLVKDQTECSIICSTSTSCAFFTYFERQCYLKKDGSGRISSPGRVSGRCNAAVGPLLWEPGCTTTQCDDTSGFARAVQVAESADAVIVMLALDQALESEGHDRADIALPANQYRIVRQLRQQIALSVPIIALLVHGGTVSLDQVLPQVDAVLDAWYPGIEGGNGIADVIFGLYSPAGRSPVTYYRDNTQLPAPGTMDLYPKNGSSLGLTYRFYTGVPQVPFGFGLSYSNFSYSKLVLNSTTQPTPSYTACQVIGLKVDVTNTGYVTSDEVVQVYLRQPLASVPVPSIRLAAFERVYGIAPGATRTVSLEVWPEWHAIVGQTADIYQGVQIVEKGTIQLYVGGGQPDYFPGRVTSPVMITTTQDISTC